MATADYIIANQSGAAFRTDLNNTLAAIVSNNSNSSEPATKYAYQWWADTSNAVMKIRNSANDGWIELFQLDGTLTLEDGSASAPALAFRDDLDTGIFSSDSNKLNIATSGVERVEFGAATIFNEGGEDVDFRIEGSSDGSLFYLDAGNNRIGLSTSSPSSLLHLDASGGADQRFTRTSGATSGNLGRIIFGSTDVDNTMCELISFQDGATDAAGFQIRVQPTGGSSQKNYVIHSSGHHLFGTNFTKRTNLKDGNGDAATPAFQFETANSDTNKNMSLVYGRNNSNGAEFSFGKHRSASVNGNTIAQDDDEVGVLAWLASDGTNLRPVAYIRGRVNGSIASSDTPGMIEFATTADGANVPTTHMKLNSMGMLGLGTTSPTSKFTIHGVFESHSFDSTGGSGGRNRSLGLLIGNCFDAGKTALGDDRNAIIWYERGLSIAFATNNTVRFGILSGGNVTTTGQASFHRNNAGVTMRAGDSFTATRDSGTPVEINRTTNDGGLITFYQDNSSEGSISVSGSSVSYNGGVITRWSQLKGISTTDKSARPTIYRGTVMSNLDDMCVWSHADKYWENDNLYVDGDTIPSGKKVGDIKHAKGSLERAAHTEQNLQLNMTKISDTETDKDVAGVFWGWDDEDDEIVNDFYIAMTGDMVIRVAASTTVARGDLLISAGDGTAKPQADDIIRSSTIAKITSATATETFADGSKAYPCVLMAC